MALKFFTQADIENMTPETVTEEFIAYFDSLSEARKADIIESNPDLAAVLYSSSMSEVAGNSEDAVNQNNDEFFVIRNNVYDGIQLLDEIRDEMEPVEALAIKEKQEKCLLHRKPFKKMQITYRRGNTYAMYVYLCVDCNRMYVEATKMEALSRNLTMRGISHKFYDLDITQRFLRSNMEAVEIEAEEKLFIPDVWIEENPTCPLHKKELDKLECIKSYKDRSVRFFAYCCDDCGKKLIRRAAALELEDECAIKGVPTIEFEELKERKPQKKVLPKEEVRPDYYIDRGKRVPYRHSYNADCYFLTESDTVVVSDSMYCELPEHDSDEVLVMFTVDDKKAGKQNYLCLAGYCAQCQKYYLDEMDFKAIYGLGRPEVGVIYDLEGHSYVITSGEVFEGEKQHLAKVEGVFEQAIEEIHSQPDWVPMFATDIYDDGSLSFAKTRSLQKYGERLAKIESYIPKPYKYRVDVSFANETKVFYLGPEDIEMDGRLVYSYNGALGRELVNTRTTKIIINGKQYNVKLNREFTIENAQLYSYVNLKTDEDLIFRSGITDPFLIRVLQMRRKQHNLTDIIATIQENQNAIVDVPLSKGIIVQGCAGSGKTMVMLHRLSALKYNNPEYDFGKAVILTPNSEFNLHISGLVESMQIGFIERVSVEQYYLNLLLQYSDEFKPENPVRSEVYLYQPYVDYIYSNDYLSEYREAYSEVMGEIKEKLSKIISLSEKMGHKMEEVIPDSDSHVVSIIGTIASHLSAYIVEQSRREESAKAEIIKIEDRKVFLSKKIPEVEALAGTVVSDSVPRVFTKIAARKKAIGEKVAEIEMKVAELKERLERERASRFPFGKAARVEELENKYNEGLKKLDSEKRTLLKVEALFDNSIAEKSEDEVMLWMRSVASLVSEVADEVRLCDRVKSELKDYASEMAEVDSILEAAKEKYAEAASTGYVAEVHGEIAEISSWLKGKTVLGFFSEVFEKATSRFKTDNKIKDPVGVHRYDLYAQLLFAMNFFGRKVGGNQLICVDEGQDLSYNEYRLISVINQNDVIFNIFGDTNQLLKPGRGISDWSELEKKFQMEVHKLNENYRNTNQITRFCNDSFDMKVLQTGVDGAKVREIARKEFENELAQIVLGNERVAILTSRKVNKGKSIDKELLPTSVQELIGESIKNGRIALMYVDSVKGIEFDKVYVLPNKMTRNEKYIAYTRALSELIIVVEPEDSNDNPR